MPSIVRNLTTHQVVLNLLGGNSMVLLPIGTRDINGPADRGILLEGEEQAFDVENALNAREVALEPVPPSPAAVSGPAPAAEPVTTPKKSRRTNPNE